jgi:hypothetical protein
MNQWYQVVYKKKETNDTAEILASPLNAAQNQFINNANTNPLDYSLQICASQRQWHDTLPTIRKHYTKRNKKYD